MSAQEDDDIKKAIGALDAITTIWASKFDLRGNVKTMLKYPDAEDRLVKFIKHAYSEGAYDGRTSLQ